MKKLFGILVFAILFAAQPSFVASAASNGELANEYAYSFSDPVEIVDQRPLVLAQSDTSQPAAKEAKEKKDDYDDEYEDEGSLQAIADPLEGLNRAFYSFNDGLYFYIFKPIGRGLQFILPEPVRVAIRNFFYNLRFPARFVNCLLQGKLDGAASELARFLVNSTAGVAGFFDIATRAGLKNYEEDFGQTLAFWGLGNGFYLDIPFFGPSSARDGFGLIVDGFLWPPSYIDPFWVAIAIRVVEALNNVSLTIGEYEALKEAALDPYIAIRDAYFQYRETKIKQ